MSDQARIDGPETTPPPRAWHAISGAEALAALATTKAGLDGAEARARLRRYGPNRLPKARRIGFATIYLRQFKNPLVYLLVLATLVSVGVGEVADALFIFVVLQFNAIIGTLQERRAQRSAEALDELIRDVAVTRRDGEWVELDAEDLVPGDLVRLESGTRISADLRLVESQELRADESLLTGESTPVAKAMDPVLADDTPSADRSNMLFAGTTLLSGRARGVVVGTGTATQIGRIAAALAGSPGEPPPLIRRLERFSRVVGVATLAVLVLIAAVQLLQGVPPVTVFLVAVALAVAAIPEGLPIAITVALAIATNRMLRRKVIVRALPAVEGLGACTMIATDKTGTLTRNELVVGVVHLFDGAGQPVRIEISGVGYDPVGAASCAGAELSIAQAAALERLAGTAVICNEASLRLTPAGPVHLGDTVDVAFLVLAQKLGLDREALRRPPALGQIPYEPQRKFAAVCASGDDADRADLHLKGAAEVVVPRCGGVDHERVLATADALAAEGYRVIAVARGQVDATTARAPCLETLQGLVLLGFAGLIDPTRPEVPGALARCRGAGVDVRMITGDHPQTALAIGRRLELVEDLDAVVTGRDLAAAAGDPAKVDRLVAAGRVFARVEPIQKLLIVEAMTRAGEVVAVTGDGVNDAPALSAASIGVAMGQGGTDVARGAADLILADDNFATIVDGIEEGRVAYANVRKLIYLLIATGIGEIVLFLGGIVAGLPIPLFAAQLLWLNLVTNGIQDIALAFERGEPGVLDRPPRSPNEPLFNRRMVTQVMLAGTYMGLAAFLFYAWCLGSGMSEAAARNLVLLLMVMFENAHALNARSETRSVLQVPLSANWFLIIAIVAAHALHLGVMFVPGIADVLRITPIGLGDWLRVGAVAVTLIGVMEIYKLVVRRRQA